MKQTWWIIGVVGRIIIGLFVVIVAAALSFPFIASRPREFVDLAGEEAESHLRHYLSEDVDLADLETASGKIYSQIDCHAHWFRITLQPEAAEKWQQTIHAKLEKPTRSGDRFEGVHRRVTAPSLVESPLGKAPKWWMPPAGEFRGTERMCWSSATYANALYSRFDPSTNTLWIYDYGQQHGQLWSRGSVPAGVQFVSAASMQQQGPEPELDGVDSTERR